MKDEELKAITKSIEDARKVLYQTSSHLRSLHDISAIQEGTGDKIKRITKKIILLII